MMNNNVLYYLNRGNTPNCPQIPTRYTNYLDRNNFLSEFITSTDKEIARLNLGIPDIIQELNYKIDSKVIDKGNIAWDLIPTEGNTEKILSSHALHNTFLKYALKTELDNNIQLVWSDTVNKINNTYNKVEDELNLLNTDLRAYTDELRCEFDSFTTYIKLEFTKFTEHIVSEFTRLENETNTKIEDLRNFVNQKVSELETFVNNKVENLTNYVDESIRELTDFVNSKVSDFTDFVNTLVTKMKTEMLELKKDVKTTLDKFQEDKYAPLESRMKSIELLMKTFLQSAAGGTALTDKFGDSEYIGVNQKVLTDSINRIWERFSEISGEDYKGIALTVSPEYFIGENGCEIHIIASSEKTTGKFEYIELYINGEKIYKQENIEYLEYDIHVSETSVLMVKAKILGIEYTQMKTITHYNSFWLGAGTSYKDVMNVEHIIPITNGMKGNYNIYFRQNDNLFVIVGDTLREGFARADMNGMEIPFTESEITVNGNIYKVFTSNNTYKSGTYNIDINS